MRIRLALVAGLLAVVAACSGGDDEPTGRPQAIQSETSVTTTTVAPTTTTPNGLGVTQNYRYEDPDNSDVFTGKVTVFRYRDASALERDVESEQRRKGFRTVVVEVRICVTEAPAPGVPLSWQPWSLGDDQGQSHEALTSWSGEITTQPTYPEDKVTPAGTCRRGWIPFEVPRTWKPDFIEYNTGRAIFSSGPFKSNWLEPLRLQAPSRASSLRRQGGRVPSR